MASADDPRHRLETPLPAPQNSEAPLASGSRWRWMDNRWLALLVTVIVSTASYFLLMPGPIWEIEHLWLRKFDSYLSSFGLGFPDMSFEIQITIELSSLLWFHPIALRLGILRAAAWMALIGAGSWLLVALLDRISYDPEDFLSMEIATMALPGLAMIGRRARPWMAMLAIVPAPIFAYTVGERMSGSWAGIVLLKAAIMSCYTAILIFGTNLIPKKPATAATTD